MLFYLLGVLFCWVVLTQESVSRAETRIQHILAACICLVWPFYAVGLLFYYKSELSYGLAVLLDYAYDPEMEGAYDPFEPMPDNVVDLPLRD